MIKLLDTSDFLAMLSEALLVVCGNKHLPIFCTCELCNVYDRGIVDYRDKVSETTHFFLLYFFFSKPKHQSGLNFVCLGIMNDRVTASCWPVMTLHSKYCTMVVFLF